MLSILIPVHNYDCSRLVAGLAEQCLHEGLPYEILVMDDASTLFVKENEALADLPGCRLLKSSENLHSARTRNRLARQAQYPYLLFVDSDLELRDNLFIHRYVEALGSAPVLVGSILYQSDKPKVTQMLRWKYGRKRECLPLQIRNEQPWKSLSSQNFMMEKAAFDEVPFDESFVRYGHEDTLMGLMLQKKGFRVLYIDNPLIHKGLESSETFLDKSLVATGQYATMPVMRTPEVVANIRIFHFYEWVSNLKLDGLLAFKFRLLEKCLRRQLCGPHPNLFLFDFYRLGYLCDFIRKRRRSGLEV